MLSDKAEELLQQMLKSGDSQQLAVAECLLNIAENGGEQEQDEFLASCANEIAKAATYVAEQLGSTRDYTVFCREASGKGTMWVGHVEAVDVEEAKHLGLAECSQEWGWENQVEGIRVLGVAYGDVNFNFWDDEPDVWSDEEEPTKRE